MNNKILTIIFAGIILMVMTCCDNGRQQSKWIKISQLEDEVSYLKETNKELRRENEELKDQVSNLVSLKKDVRMEQLANLARIAIDSRSGLFDKDDDGKKETLIVYIKTYDETGDVIKATGKVNLQLWDLSKTGEAALLNEWNVEPEELKKRWMGMLLTDYYRLSYKVADIIGDEQKALTVKVKFTDYLTGKVFTEQMVINRS